jgi:hypothetical protein
MHESIMTRARCAAKMQFMIELYCAGSSSLAMSVRICACWCRAPAGACRLMWQSAIERADEREVADVPVGRVTIASCSSALTTNSWKLPSIACVALSSSVGRPV